MPNFTNYQGGSRPIAKWTEGFETLYKRPDANRRPEEFWNATMAHVSGIGEAIRRTHYRDLVKRAAHAFCWMCSYAGNCNSTTAPLFRLTHNLSEIVGFKYPNVCGHCTTNRCKCSPVEMDAKQDKTVTYEWLLQRWSTFMCTDCTLDQWLNNFWEIYSGQIHLQGLESIGFHLLEEAGEEAKAVRGLVQFSGILHEHVSGIDGSFLDRICSIPGLVEEYSTSIKTLKDITGAASEKEARDEIDLTTEDPVVIKARLVMSKMNFVVELADTFSWYCAVLLKLTETLRNQGLDGETLKAFHIEEVLKDRYASNGEDDPLKCYACGETDCKCLFFPDASG